MVQRLRVAFFGSYPYSVAHLESLADDPRIELVRIVSVAQPGDNPVSQWAVDNACRAILRHPAAPTEEQALADLAASGADILVSAAYPRRIPEPMLKCCVFGGVNVHPSLLPRWRGPDPIRRSILAGDLETGSTIHRLVQEFDAGGIYWQSALRMSADETCGELLARLAEQSAKALPNVIQAVAEGELSLTSQIGTPSYAPTVSDEERRISPRATVEHARRLIRAVAPYSCAYWTNDSAEYEIHSCTADPAIGEVLEITLADGILRCTGKRIDRAEAA